MKIIDGTAIARKIEDDLRKKIETLKGRPPALAMILVGEHSSSEIYVKRKVKACERVGIHSLVSRLPHDVSNNALLKQIEHFNQNPDIDGILLQLPLPPQIDQSQMMRWILPQKDVDGFHPINLGKLLSGDTTGLFPCTPLGIREILNVENIDLYGKHVVILGRGNLVGKPLAAMLLQRNQNTDCTVTIANQWSQDIPSIARLGDVLIVAIGKPHEITPDMVKKGAIVIDVGINRLEDEKTKIVGDVHEGVREKCAMITPVPGGVGPMTIAMLLSNTYKAYTLSHHSS